jgi:chromosome segregation ATPase
MNISKINEFHKAWSALLEPLPDVVRELEQREELKRQVAALELRRERSIEEAKAGVDKLTATAERLSSEVKALNAEKSTATNDLAAHRKACAAEIDALNRSVAERAAEVKRQVDAIQAETVSAEKEKLARLKKAEEDHATVYAKMEREIADLEGRRKSAEEALSRLKARLES